ncbi:hypothetical protein L7F22_047582 [Adiantum nelumboides]|nr:hypothetical protein [Adiantum nelumboides]
MAGSDARDVLEAEFVHWAQEQEEIIEELGRALRAERQGLLETDRTVVQAVARAVQHYQDYYRLTRIHQNKNVGVWPTVSGVEKAFMWMGSLQRPSTAFQLLYALMGHQIEAELEELLELENSEDGRLASLAALSAQQLTDLDNLQKSTMKEEDRIERESAKMQQTLADKPLLFSGQSTRDAALSSSDAAGSGSAQISSSFGLRHKVTALQDLCMQADALHKSTVDRVLEVLHTPYQKGEYLLASAKLQVALRKLGHN